jgi:hypothetical protein
MKEITTYLNRRLDLRPDVDIVMCPVRGDVYWKCWPGSSVITYLCSCKIENKPTPAPGGKRFGTSAGGNGAA